MISIGRMRLKIQNFAEIKAINSYEVINLFPLSAFIPVKGINILRYSALLELQPYTSFFFFLSRTVLLKS